MGVKEGYPHMLVKANILFDRIYIFRRKLL